MNCIAVSHYIHTKSPPQLSHLSRRATGFSILGGWMSVSCVISHRFATVTTSRSSLNVWLPRFCFSDGKEWQSLGEEFPWRNHNRWTFLSYHIVHLFYIRPLYQKLHSDQIMTHHPQLTIHCLPSYLVITVQQDATIYSFLFPANCSTCFGWYLHPSSGAHVIRVYMCSWWWVKLSPETFTAVCRK